MKSASRFTLAALQPVILPAIALGVAFAFVASSAPARASEPVETHLDGPRPDPARVEELSRSPQWLRLLHYKGTFPFGRKKSQVDDKGFFLSKEGATDPRAELEATVRAFSSTEVLGKMKQQAQCAFPERYRYLKSELKLDVKDVECPKLHEFLDRFNARSATLIFSSAYPNNPGSMFGHTFLRINSKADPKTNQEKLDLLDYGLNYAASVPPDENGAAFVWFGLTGGYPGQFSMVPYYVKVKEYSNGESRDLWEYDLNLSEEETRRLLMHAWELETNGHFDYYFFDENCSYMLLTLLEAVKPEWELSDFPVHVIPGETVKRLTRTPGAVTAVHFRPSLRKTMLRKHDALSPAQKEAFDHLVDGRPDQPAIRALTDVEVVDSAISYLYYKKQRDSELDSDDKERLRLVMLRRSQLGNAPAPARTDPVPPGFEDTRPDLGHDAYRLGTSGGLQRGLRGASSDLHYFQELSFKFAYHDLLNKDLGFMRFSQVDFPGFTLRYDGTDRALRLERIGGLAITSLFPLTFLEKRLSWKVELDYRTPRDFGCDTCHAVHGEGGAGVTIETFTPDWIFYGLVLAQVEAGENFGSRSFRYGPGAQLATIVHPLANLKIRFAWNGLTDLGQSIRRRVRHEFEWDQSWSFSPAWEARTSVLSITGPVTEAKLTLNHYF